MLLGHGSDGEPQVYAQLGQHHPRRITVSALGDSLLFENLAACGLQVCGGGELPELALARSDRFVAVLSAPLVEQP